jgi:hypothetical protein
MPTHSLPQSSGAYASDDHKKRHPPTGQCYRNVSESRTEKKCGAGKFPSGSVQKNNPCVLIRKVLVKRFVDIPTGHGTVSGSGDGEDGTSSESDDEDENFGAAHPYSATVLATWAACIETEAWGLCGKAMRPFSGSGSIGIADLPTAADYKRACISSEQHVTPTPAGAQNYLTHAPSEWSEGDWAAAAVVFTLSFMTAYPDAPPLSDWTLSAVKMVQVSRGAVHPNRSPHLPPVPYIAILNNVATATSVSVVL